MHNSQKVGHSAGFTSKRKGKNIFVNKHHTHHHHYPTPPNSYVIPPLPVQSILPPIPIQPLPIPVIQPPAPIPVIQPPRRVQSTLPPLPPNLQLPDMRTFLSPAATYTGYAAARGQAGVSHTVSTYNNPSIPPSAPSTAPYRHHPYAFGPMKKVTGTPVSYDGKIDINDIYENYEMKRLKSENIRLQALVDKSEAERQRKKAAKKEKKRQKKERAKQKAIEDDENSNSNSNSRKSTKSKPAIKST